MVRVTGRSLVASTAFPSVTVVTPVAIDTRAKSLSVMVRVLVPEAVTWAAPGPPVAVKVRGNVSVVVSTSRSLTAATTAVWVFPFAAPAGNVNIGAVGRV